jgi:hypothetical protein
MTKKQTDTKTTAHITAQPAFTRETSSVLKFRRRKDGLRDTAYLKDHFLRS